MLAGGLCVNFESSSSVSHVSHCRGLSITSQSTSRCLRRAIRSSSLLRIFRIFSSFSADFIPRQETLPRSHTARRRIPDPQHRRASTRYGPDLRNLRRKRCKHPFHPPRQRQESSKLRPPLRTEQQRGTLADNVF